MPGWLFTLKGRPERMRNRQPSIIGLLALLTATTGCATIGYRPPVVEDRTLSARRVEMVAPGASASVEHDGNSVSITASHLCNVHDEQRIERTSTRDAYNKDGGITWFYAGLGAVTAGTGMGLIVDSGGTYPNDTTSRTYNETGPDAEIGYGAVLVAGGVALLAVAAYDALLASGSEVDVVEVSEPGEPVEREIACTGRPLKNVDVFGVIDGEQRQLGTTGPDGAMTVDLDSRFHASLQLARHASMTVRIQGTEVGSVDLSGLAQSREAAAWGALYINDCKDPNAVKSCDPIRRFIERYPGGAHNREATALLREAEPKLEALRDAKAWARVDVDRCVGRGDETAFHCRELDSYLSDFPHGEHADEASETRDRLEQKAAQFVARLTARAQAAETKAAKTAARQVKAELRKRLIECKRQGRAMCDVMCASWQFRHDPTGCRRGCLVRQVEQECGR